MTKEEEKEMVKVVMKGNFYTFLIALAVSTFFAILVAASA